MCKSCHRNVIGKDKPINRSEFDCTCEWMEFKEKWVNTKTCLHCIARFYREAEKSLPGVTCLVDVYGNRVIYRRCVYAGEPLKASPPIKQS